jgi:putative FmdB family regulatory protein
MPIYEFYCEPCNTVFSFFSRGVNTARIPACPVCRRPLKRQMSIFARVSRGKEEPAGDEMPPIDEAKMEKAMAMLAGEAEKMNEDDPRQAAQLMRKLTDATGISLGAGMEEALHRLERGEDPDRIEEEMGDLLEGEEPFLFEGKGKRGSRKPKPRVDETLYDL